MKRAYRLMLGLYPSEYREFFGAEMSTVFEQAANDRPAEGLAAFLIFALAELIGLVIGAGAEWIAKGRYLISHSNSYISTCCQPDQIMIRPAGVAWEAYYGKPPSQVHTEAMARGQRAGDLNGHTGPCINARQKFAMASTLRRLLILACGASKRCVPSACPRNPLTRQ